MSVGLYLYATAYTDSLPLALPLGLADEPTELIREDRLTAVCCRIDPTRLSVPEPLTDADRQRLIDFALRHEAVIEAALAAGPVLPVRFGTLFADEMSLRRFLRSHRATIESFLATAAGHDEWDLKLFADLSRGREQILLAEPDLAERVARLPNSRGARYLVEKKLHAEADQRLRQRLQTEAAELIESLASMCLTLLDGSGRQYGGPIPLLHRIGFVAKAQATAFAAQIRDWAAARESLGVSLRLTGPWPPFHFAPKLDAEVGGLRNEPKPPDSRIDQLRHAAE